MVTKRRTSGPVPMLCTYRPRKGREAAFLRLLERHWPALRRAGLAAPVRPTVHRSVDRKGRTVFVETFSWADGEAAEAAHRSPEVMAVWGPMEALAAEMEFLDLEPVRLGARGAAPGTPRARR
jgi:quinol monooxygenase YgiN